jgi:hypothetical protein
LIVLSLKVCFSNEYNCNSSKVFFGSNNFVCAMQVVIRATGPKSSEMVTDEGAIYVTSNNGYNWKAAVEETVSATLNRYVI